MSGTRAGGLKAAKTNKKRYGKDFYKIQGAKGGQNGHTGGFYNNQTLAKRAGALGGSKSRRDDAYRWWKENGKTVKRLRKNGFNWGEIAEFAGINRGRLMYRVNRYGGGIR